MTTIGQQRLHDLAAGTVLAMQGLREYQAVVTAAIEVVTDNRDYGDIDFRRLIEALKKGNFIE